MRQFIISILLLILAVSGCKKNDPIIPNEEEVITTIRYTLTTQVGTSPVIFEFRDIDGDGGLPPVYTESDLKPNTTYEGRLELLNEQETPAGDITEEITEEGEAHQFFFQPSSGLNMSITYKDKDRSDRPIGLLTTIVTGASGTGQLKITLRHEPNKSAQGVADGQIAQAGGETDIEIEFNVHVQ